MSRIIWFFSRTTCRSCRRPPPSCGTGAAGFPPGRATRESSKTRRLIPSAQRPKTFLPAQTWLRVTGDAGRAAGLLEGECARGCYLVCPQGSEAQVLEMYCESLQLLNFNGQFPLRPWRSHPFTTFLQAEDNVADFQWRACQAGHARAPAGPATRNWTHSVALASVCRPNSLVKVLARRRAKASPTPPST